MVRESKYVEVPIEAPLFLDGLKAGSITGYYSGLLLRVITHVIHMRYVILMITPIGVAKLTWGSKAVEVKSSKRGLITHDNPDNP